MSPSGEQAGAKSHHRKGGGFCNPWPGAQPHGLGGILKWAVSRRKQRDALSDDRLPIIHHDSHPQDLPGFPKNALAITWIGHTTFLIQCGGVNILTDPIWSDRASPVSFAGPRRFSPPGIPFENLPEIHATLVSHDHYDHLDDATVRQLIHRFPRMHWLAPLGVGSFLKHRGAVDITQLDWWEERDLELFWAGCTPAQHFSGRFPWNRNATLWCGWAIRIGEFSFFFAGDSGLHPEFRTIGDRFGPFDAAILPIGAYDPRWFMQPVHMDPAETVSAYRQLTGDAPVRQCVMIPSHWGTFKLTDEPPGEPPVATRQAWRNHALDEDLLTIFTPGSRRIITR